MSKSLQEQLKALNNKIQKNSQRSYNVYELFSDDFFKAVNISENIDSIFKYANVDIDVFPKIVDLNYLKLSNIVLRYGFKSWDDFLESAKKYQSLKQLKAKGYNIT